eukprot:CAMPEP_0197688126 /NCGR_PEP_ID=MMETSP1338-20131121/104976_1 /TAXON_ID=43686 ORGANISM="Pelagodinium beii, Strain RCC1491" /NCGR_SAMPLE_ID=MMETSP1338 /ASSEMBLY_ACC=CAM_ASM_000754 /LENGTH=97 /DNA_ID=CAMNT_0043270303 /DNA_START=20 /DNA_END=310 /DNA_ORIENTATION=-
MRTLPRDLLKEAKTIFSLPWEDTEETPGHHAAGDSAYKPLATELLRWTGQKLSTEHTAKYLLDTMNVDLETGRVLYLPCSPFDNFPSYLTASVFHGL